MTFWEFVNDTAAVATLIGFPVGIAGGIATFVAWGNKMSRVFSVLAIVVLVSLCAADISVRAGWLTPTLEDIHDRTFRNERVELDGKRFVRCKFINVTFVINNRGGTEISDSDFAGYSIASDNADIQSAISKLNALGAISIPVLGMDGKVIPPFGENPHFGPRPPR